MELLLNFLNASFKSTLQTSIVISLQFERNDCFSIINKYIEVKGKYCDITDSSLLYENIWKNLMIWTLLLLHQIYQYMNSLFTLSTLNLFSFSELKNFEHIWEKFYFILFFFAKFNFYVFKPEIIKWKFFNKFQI
jgi:hypothetical protein